MLAGHEESGGTIVEENGEEHAVLRHELRVGDDLAMWAVSRNTARREGKTVKLPLRGPVENTARYFGGLRSACTYVGASRLKELTKRVRPDRVQEQENRVFVSLSAALAYSRGASVSHPPTPPMASLR